jgi:hypothetical protein
MSVTYEIYAIRYATMTPRTPQMNYLAPDPHETAAADLDYFVWLIRGGGRDILVDTGFNEAASKERSRKLTINPIDALADFGVRAADIRDVIVTHLHYDHAGNLDRLPNARFHLQDREMSYATGRCMCNGLLRHPFSAEDVTLMVRHVFNERVTFHNGDGEVAPGVTLHRVGGHSDGCRSCACRPRAGRWCSPRMPRIITAICSAAARFRSSTISATCATAGRPASALPAIPIASFPAMIRWCANFIRASRAARPMPMRCICRHRAPL